MAASEQELRFASALRTNPLIRAATIVLAASDARQQWASQADIVCSGTNDDEALGTAINALPSLGGRIILSEGTFSLSASISSAKNGVLVRGMGPGTVLSGGTVTLSGTDSGLSELTMSGTYQSAGGSSVDLSALAADLLPATDDSITLGDATHRFKEVHASDFVEADEVQVNGVAAKGFLTIDTLFTVGKQVTIGSVTYTIVTDGTASSAGQVNRGTNVTEAQDNLGNAVIGDGNNVANPDAAYVEQIGNVTTYQASSGFGVAGNSVATTTNSTDGTNGWANAHMTGGVDTILGYALRMLSGGYLVGRNQADDDWIKLIGANGSLVEIVDDWLEVDPDSGAFNVYGVASFFDAIIAGSLPSSDPGSGGMWVNAANHNAVTIGSGA